jgi:serine/threonine protein kinase
VEKRAAFLDSVCDGDRDMRAEVERALAGCEEASLRSPAADLLSAAAELSPGDTVAQFRIDAKLGEGGMGTVYRAWDIRLQRGVALKVLQPDAAGDSERRKRLLKEARAACALTHPNIVTVYEISSDRGVDFIAMELVEGQTLASLIRPGGLPLPQALDYAIAIAGALAKAHGAGIAHRDLKPANIMVAAGGQLKLLDFGLARRAFSVEGETLTVTASGVISGTPAYMSPEQARGEKTDARTDLFSLGVVLFEMLAGRRPFEGDNPSHALLCILEKPPLPIERYLPQAPAELRRILAKALEKDPEKRYQSARDFELDLERLARSLDQPRAATPARRRKQLLALASTVLLVVMGGGSFGVTAPPRSPTRTPSLSPTSSIPRATQYSTMR